MGYYIKVTKEVASELLPAGVKPTKTKDDNCLLWQSELNEVEGINLSERCKTVGGALLTEQQASDEIQGCDSPAYCYTPVAYGGEGDTRGSDFSENKSNERNLDYTQDVKVPSVEQETKQEEDVSDE